MDLRETFGKKFKVTKDASWKKETTDVRREARLNGLEGRYDEIKGKYGVLYLYDEKTVAVMVNSNRVTRQIMRAFNADVTILQRGDDEITLIAEERHATRLLKYLKPERLRIYSSEERARRAERLRPYRFEKKNPPQQLEGSEGNDGEDIHQKPWIPKDGSKTDLDNGLGQSGINPQ